VPREVALSGGQRGQRPQAGQQVFATESLAPAITQAAILGDGVPGEQADGAVNDHAERGRRRRMARGRYDLDVIAGEMMGAGRQDAVDRTVEQPRQGRCHARGTGNDGAALAELRQPPGVIPVLMGQEDRPQGKARIAVARQGRHNKRETRPRPGIDREDAVGAGDQIQVAVRRGRHGRRHSLAHDDEVLGQLFHDIPFVRHAALPCGARQRR